MIVPTYNRVQEEDPLAMCRMQLSKHQRNNEMKTENTKGAQGRDGPRVALKNQSSINYLLPFIVVTSSSTIHVVIEEDASREIHRPNAQSEGIKKLCEGGRGNVRRNGSGEKRCRSREKGKDKCERNKLRQIGRWVDSSSNSYLEKVRPSWLFENVCHCDRA